MKKQLILCLLFAAFGFISCSKERTPKSVWYIDGKKYSSRNVELGYNYNTTYLWPETILKVERGKKFNGSIVLFFTNMIQLPESGKYLITRDENRSSVYIQILLDKNDNLYHFYNISPHSERYITASTYKGRAKFEVEPAWFVALGGTDSFLFGGTFYEPVSE